MIRRWIRQAGSIAILGWAWQHRGSLARGIDLAKRTPELVRNGRTSQLAVEARAVVALDGPLASNTHIRITGIDDGSVMLRGQPSGTGLEVARATLTSLPDVVDVRTDNRDQPTLDSLLTTSS